MDRCLGTLTACCQAKGYGIIILADHGNAECMVTKDGERHTAHTYNPVPCVLIENGDKKVPLRKGGKLTDIAPTILGRMGLPIPVEMTGRRLDCA